jgi:hypothetical protein
MRRSLVLAAAALLTAAAPSAATAAGFGPPSIQHQFTNGPFATAEWTSQIGQKFTDTTVTAVRHPGGGAELTVDQIVETSTSDRVTSADVSSGFTFTIDATHLSGATVHGAGLPARTCSLTCHATTISVSATWTGQGTLTRGAVNSKDIEPSNFLYIQIEHFAGASRNATATGTIGAYSYITADAFAPILGNMHTGYFFLCMAAGCEN